MAVPILISLCNDVVLRAVHEPKEMPMAREVLYFHSVNKLAAVFGLRQAPCHAFRSEEKCVDHKRRAHPGLDKNPSHRFD